jgi:hypothetical protein
MRLGNSPAASSRSKVDGEMVIPRRGKSSRVRSILPGGIAVMVTLSLRLTAMKYSHATKRFYSGAGTKKRRFRSNVQLSLRWQRDLASDQPIEVLLKASHLMKD